MARASRKHPVLLEMLRDGRIHLSGIALLAPHLTARNCPALSKRATHKTKRQIEEIVAELTPRPDVAAGMRKLPTPRSNGEGRTAEDGRSALDDLPGVVAGTVPRSRPDDFGAPVVDGRGYGPRASSGRCSRSPDFGAASCREGAAPGSGSVPGQVHREPGAARQARAAPGPDALVGSRRRPGRHHRRCRHRETAEAGSREAGKTKTPRKSLAETDTTPMSRHIPAAVRRAVWARDGGRCTWSTLVEGAAKPAKGSSSTTTESPWARWRSQCRQRQGRVPDAQRADGREGIRQGEDGRVSAGTVG